MFNDAIILNQIAQGLRSPDDGLAWFLEQSVGRRHQILRELANMMYQAHPLPEEIPRAIEETGLKPTFTPCVLLLKGESDRQRYQRAWQIASLPEDEHQKSFRLLMKVFQIADGRRRETQCQGNCTHWWHQDLKESSNLG